MLQREDRFPERRLTPLFLALVVFASGCGGGGAERPPVVAGKASESGPSGKYEEVAVTDGGTLEGTVLIQGEAPPPQKIRVARPSDRTVCGTEKLSAALRAGPAGEVRDAIVYLDGIRRGKPLSSLASPPPIDQERCEYVPHVAIYPTGASLDLRSSDPILHNVHAYLKGGETLFNAAMPRRGMKLAKPLPVEGWVTLRCDVHQWMNGAVWITDHPYATVTDDSGKFTLTEVPPGKHSLKVWHPVLGEAGQEVEVQTGKTAVVAIRMPLKR